MVSSLTGGLVPLISKLLFVLVGLSFALTALYVLLRLYLYVSLLRQDSVYLELTPPAFTDRTPQATQELFVALHSIGMSRPWYERWLRRVTCFSLEIVSTKKEGIRFLIRVSRDKAAIFEQSITAYLPEVRVRVIEDYISQKPTETRRVISFKQQQHFAYPMQGQDELESHDPIAYMTNAMTKLENGEMMSLQLVVRPVRISAAESLSKRILYNEELLPKMNGGVAWSTIFGGINRLLFSVTDAVGNGYHGASKTAYNGAQKELEYKQQVAKHIKPARTLSYFEHELIESIHQKLSQPLFSTELRALFVVSSKKELSKRQKGIEAAIGLLTVPKYQSLRRRRFANSILKRYQLFSFTNRLPPVFGHSNIFSASELASLYHFPHSTSGKTDNVVTAISRTLAAPIALKNGTKLDILLGENTHHGVTTPIGLTAGERERHLYIIGGTGNGKTTMLLYGIIQDIRNGNGVAVLDPHGDLAETILRHIPEERIQDVIYLNPDDLGRPIGINLLELPEGLSGDELLREKDLVTESTISVLRKIFSEDDSGGHRIEYVLRNTIQTALTTEGANLFTIFRLLNDSKYRRIVVKQLEDQDLKNFWNNELGKAGEFQRVKMAAGITSKIGRFLFSASAKRILEQEKSTIDFEDVLNSGKILICNFSKGLLGEDTSTLFGTTILAKLQVASLRRARIKQAARKPYYLYVDEFQNFATMSFVQMLSEARKYKLFLTMAEQSTSQQDEQRLVDIILANVGTVICFRSGSPADERYVLPLFSPYIEQGEIANLPAYNFYARIAAVNTQEPMSGSTVLLDSDGSDAIAKAVVEHSRRTYGVKVPQVKASLQPQESENSKAFSKNKSTTTSRIKKRDTLPSVPFI